MGPKQDRSFQEKCVQRFLQLQQQQLSESKESINSPSSGRERGSSRLEEVERRSVLLCVFCVALCPAELNVGKKKRKKKM